MPIQRRDILAGHGSRCATTAGKDIKGMSRDNQPLRTKKRRAAGLGVSILAIGLLAGCEGGDFSLPFGAKDGASAPRSTSTKLVERDVEAPEVFSATDEGLWDGRPSLGGVWVAHPDVTEPERVIVRNEANGKFVIGALFRRERELPGPKLQISSDAAAALGILAGAPAPLNVTALRREESAAPEGSFEAENTGDATSAIAAPAPVTATALEPAATAPAKAAASTTPTAAAPAPAAQKPASPAAGAKLSKPFVQLGIFSVEANATRTAKQMRGAGMVPTVKESSINNKPFWRVVIGPATSQSELDSLLKKVKAEGFTDAYAVSN
ncbi:MAG TPA: SPOR domain-containing protein [Sulfitobacter sp.]|nr:SPOR domain-containing protein [Sulfitobacter sp.]HBB81816.1 SPOR domain-containing protein [Sulfitobacter sp.]